MNIRINERLGVAHNYEKMMGELMLQLGVKEAIARDRCGTIEIIPKKDNSSIDLQGVYSAITSNGYAILPNNLEEISIKWKSNIFNHVNF